MPDRKKNRNHEEEGSIPREELEELADYIVDEWNKEGGSQSKPLCLVSLIQEEDFLIAVNHIRDLVLEDIESLEALLTSDRKVQLTEEYLVHLETTLKSWRGKVSAFHSKGL
ncbi:hypothetical protein [Alkalihalophilus marmarensis]|uniref:Uncharacterized protein n=1 Tax=Alkalihalophilus marmarensis DSM 21297 TaxID=1188261 RepID=U6SN63_9BACI|nr:hypothetical protein [Alkalihalophilus marmarensis]ERN52081.1 hypothetical protein A33I_18485 [Alkalihalophilus marmarensis DSM 21297]